MTTRRTVAALLLAIALSFAAGRATAAPRSGPEIVGGLPTPSGRLSPVGTAQEPQAPSEAPNLAGVSSAPLVSPSPDPTQPTTAPVATPGDPGPVASVVSVGRGVSGLASWYRYLPGQAAAGPRLRALLGPGWRGMVVTIYSQDLRVEVRLTDWCQCFEGTSTERVIDLDSRTVIALGFRLSAGLYEVTVTW